MAISSLATFVWVARLDSAAIEARPKHTNRHGKRRHGQMIRLGQQMHDGIQHPAMVLTWVRLGERGKQRQKNCDGSFMHVDLSCR
jgi:hypothetical protein